MGHSLPTDEGGFREAEPSYDEVQTLCDPGWQSQPMIDHNLCTKYLENGRLTLTKYLFYYNTIVPHKSTQHTISLWLALTLLIYHALNPSTAPNIAASAYPRVSIEQSASSIHSVVRN